MGNHKHKVSALPEHLDIEALQQESAELPLISPTRVGRDFGFRRISSNGEVSSVSG